jgi:hypothetical protein
VVVEEGRYGCLRKTDGGSECNGGAQSEPISAEDPNLNFYLYIHDLENCEF